MVTLLTYSDIKPIYIILKNFLFSSMSFVKYIHWTVREFVHPEVVTFTKDSARGIGTNIDMFGIGDYWTKYMHF